MAYRKKTLRSMSPVTRKVARLIGELDSVSRRLKNLVPEIHSLEGDSRALLNGQRLQADRAAKDKVYHPDRELFAETKYPEPLHNYDS